MPPPPPKKKEGTEEAIEISIEIPIVNRTPHSQDA